MMERNVNKMKKNKIIYAFYLFLVCLLILAGNMNVNQAYGATHSHTDACYAGHRHAKSGCQFAGKFTRIYALYSTSQSGSDTWAKNTKVYCGDCNRMIFELAYSERYSSGYSYKMPTSTGIAYYHYNNSGQVIRDVYQIPDEANNPNYFSLTSRYIYNDFTFRLNQSLSAAGYESKSPDGNSFRTRNFSWSAGFIPVYPAGRSAMEQPIWLPWVGCSYCGTYGQSYSCSQIQDENPICPAYTVAPSIHLYKMEPNFVLTKTQTNVRPQIVVYDNENDNLTCNYYIDGTLVDTMPVIGSYPEKVVTFTKPINVASLAEGAHTIKVTASDNYAKYIGEYTINFSIDNSSPIIKRIGVTRSINSISLEVVEAKDEISGLAESAYCYTIGGVKTVWLTEPRYTMSGLTPNTEYAYTIEVRDAKENISKETGIAYTKLDTPIGVATAVEGSGIKLVVKDGNPSNTLYRIQVGSQYATSDGRISTTESWFNIPYNSTSAGKQLILSGLAANTNYPIVVSVKNTSSGDFSTGTPVSVLTAPGIPLNLTVNDITRSSIYFSWSSVPGAVSYEIYRSTVTANGTVTATKKISNITNYYNDTDVEADQGYTYIIRCKNQNGVYGNWSGAPISAKTWPLPPPKITGVTAVVDGSALDITWAPVTGVVGYEVEVICNGKVWNKPVIANRLSFDITEYPDRQCNIKVKGFNVYRGSNPSDDTSWTNEGEWSNEIICQTEANIPILGEEQYTNNSVTITMLTNNNPETVRYKLYIYKFGLLDKEISFLGNTAENNKITCKITGLSPETNYSFKAKAINSIPLESDWSNEVNVKTLIDKPAVVTGLRATAKSDMLNIYWNLSERAQSYIIERNDIVIASGITEGKYIDYNITLNTEYTYRVIAVNTTGNSESASLVKRTPGNMPTSPTITSVTGSSITCTIEWAAVEGVTGYDVEVDGNIYNVSMNTSYEDNGLIPGGCYVYKVRSRNIFGKSSWSEPVEYKAIPIAPNTPVNVIADASATQIRVRWDVTQGAESYDLEIDNIVYNGILSSDYLYTSSGGALSGSQHTIRVRAVNEGGASEWSAYLTVNLSEEGSIPVIPVPVSPEIISCISGSSIIMVSWDKTENATLYQLEADGFNIYTGTGTSYVHTGLSEGSQHIYRIRAGNLSGFSDWSNSVICATGSTSRIAPENISYYSVSDKITTILWEKLANASGYRIEVNTVILDEVLNEPKAEITTIPGELYTIRIAAVDDNDSTLEWSDELVFRTPSTLPVAVKIDSVSMVSDMIILAWTEVPNAYGYDIEINGQVVNVSNVLLYTISGLESSTTYSLRVRAYNDAGAGDWCDAETIMTNGEIPGVPTNIRGKSLSINAVTGCAIGIYWDPVMGADSYEVSVSNDKTFICDTNEIIIGNLLPNETYSVNIRALTNTIGGAWSSSILLVAKLNKPMNLATELVDGVVHISWTQVNGADHYEVEVDGIIYTATDNSYVDINSALFNVQRSIRVRACYEKQKGDWSEAIVFYHPLPVSIDLKEGETFSVILPYVNANIDDYKMTISFNTTELTLLDACEITSAPELSSTYISDLNTYIIIAEQEGIEYISFIIEDSESYKGEGIVSSIKLMSKVTDVITIQYSVIAR